VRDQIPSREAMAAGLDRDDTVIRRRLRQKLEFLLEDAVEGAPPTDQELRAWLAQHASAFRTEPKVALRQVYVSRERRGKAAEADARSLLARLSAAGETARIDALGDPTMLPQEVDLAPQSEVARVFGGDFAERVMKLAPGTWTGPVASGYGLHLVLVRERADASLPDLAAIRPAVERELLADRRTRQLAAMYERLLGKYRVVIERPDSGKPAGGTRQAAP
jgi:parvulin-like peptidyl-prolyl isomerase